ncbi:S1 family peptidase [Rhodobacteraceae bacterium N5(2021)]|uniref:S1 family peptidase n=1 Tax=Gymnodinialimonas phycosphaerae TaxID=2841589 RepID=A0A975TU70_9RHOB|nr:S1 family peptidase [Gymnodinialimonas phycosphaerae]MBY4895119.1 S1 family peptidase [Gymnodinialimonas phycosphaerae]
MTPLRCAGLLLCTLTLTAPVHADIAGAPLSPPAFIEAQLSAIARLRGVDAASGGCTAVLVAPQAVLTAAHCARAPLVAPQVVIFPGAVPARHDVITRLSHPTPARRPALAISDYTTDLAVLLLARPVSPDVATPMPLGPPDPALPHGVYGFDNRDTADVLRGHAPCAVQVLDDGPLASDCHVVNGQSGGALVRFTEDGPRLVGILVAQLGGDAEIRSLAARPDPAHWRALADVLGLPAPAAVPAQ